MPDVAALRLAGRSAAECRDAGCTVPELINLCHCPWKKGEDKADWTPFAGRAVIAEGKFGVITKVRGTATEDIQVTYDDGSVNSVNTDAGYLATDWLERGSCRVLDWADNACYQDTPLPRHSIAGRSLKRVKVGRVMSWHEYRARAADEGGRLPTTTELRAWAIDVGYDQWTPVTAHEQDEQTGRIDGDNGDGTNCWANIGPRKYMTEFPEWGLDDRTLPSKHLTYFYVSLPTPYQRDAIGRVIVSDGLTRMQLRVVGEGLRIERAWYDMGVPMRKPLVKDYERLKGIVVENVPDNVLSAAAREGWVGVTPSEVKIKVCSGHGGSATFKVTRAGASTAFALHVYSRSHSQDVRFRKRGSAASAAIWAAGMAPERVAETHEWYLDVWSGGTPMDGEEHDLTVRIGRCIAKLHTVPTAWFEPHRRAAIEARPLLAELPKGTVCWYLDSRSQHWLNESKPDWALKIFAEQEIKPATAAGSRVVTAHTDIHGMNVVQAPDGDLKVIDLESTTVMHAVFDLAYPMMLWSGPTGKDKETKLALCQAYLEASGFPHSPDDVAALALDVERCKLCCGHQTHWHRAWDEISAETSKEEVENLLRAYNEERKMADEALTNNELAERMLSEGILAVVRGLTSWTGSNPIEMGRPLAVHRVAWDASATERTHFKLSGNGTIMPGDDDHPGRTRVLGVAGNEVVLTSCCDAKFRLVISASARANVPVTGLPAPTTEAVPLVLCGAHKGQGLCWESYFEHEGNIGGTLRLVPAADATKVYFEKCGAIRLAHAPEQAFDVDCWNIRDGTRVHTYAFQVGPGQQFQLNADSTLSPAGHADLVLVTTVDDADPRMKLMTKSEASEEELLVFDFPAGTGRPSVSEAEWPPAHTAADPAHFEKLKREGKVDQVWLIKKHNGERYVQHNLADGTYKAYTFNTSQQVDSGAWKMVDGAYSEKDETPAWGGILRGDAAAFTMEVDAPPHGMHYYTPTFERYDMGYLASESPKRDWKAAVMRLELESHPGKAIVLAPFDSAVIGEGDAVRKFIEGGGVLPAYKLVLGPVEDAAEVMVDPESGMMTVLTAISSPSSKRLVKEKSTSSAGSLKREASAAGQVLALGLGLPAATKQAKLYPATGPVALTDGGVATTIAEGEEAEEDIEIVTCRFIADDYIDEVFYNGVNMRDYSLLGVPFVTAGPTPADKIKTLRFSPVKGGVLAIAANDNQPGTSAAFGLRCDSTDPESDWNFILTTQNAALYARAAGTHGVTVGEAAGEDERVGSIGGKGGRPDSAIPGAGWTQNDFDDSAWEAPTKATCAHWARKHDMGDGTWYKEHKYVFYRIAPNRAP